jgi:2-iminoacetate synthase ThiH
MAPSLGAEIELPHHHVHGLCRQLVGDMVTDPVNPNLNVSNHGVQHSSVCAFRRDPGKAGACGLELHDRQERARQAQRQGATELCLQGGLNPAAPRNVSQLGWWATHTLAGATEALRWGCKDLGGSSRSSASLEAAAASLGRPARQRATLYGDLP